MKPNFGPHRNVGEGNCLRRDQHTSVQSQKQKAACLPFQAGSWEALTLQWLGHKCDSDRSVKRGISMTLEYNWLTGMFQGLTPCFFI